MSNKDYSKAQPWKYDGSIWPTEAKYWSWLRGHIRLIWEDYPVRTNFKKSQMMPIPPKMKKDFHPSTKSIGQCCQCQNWFPASRLQVDHIEETDGCKNYEEFHNFVDRMVMIDYLEMALICEPCHKNKSHAARYDMSYEEAEATRKAIAIIKRKEDKVWLANKGIIPASNEKARRKQIVEELMKDGKVQIQ